MRIQDSNLYLFCKVVTLISPNLSEHIFIYHTALYSRRTVMFVMSFKFFKSVVTIYTSKSMSMARLWSLFILVDQLTQYVGMGGSQANIVNAARCCIV